MTKITSFFLRLSHRVTSHPWLKLIALILAVMLWFYVREEMARFN